MIIQLDEVWNVFFSFKGGAGPRRIFWEDQYYALGTAGGFIHERNFW